MKASERLEMVLDYLSLKAVALANRVELSQTRIRDLIRNKSVKMPVDVAEAICVKFPTISRDWLLTGEGDMLVKNDQSEDNIKIISTPAEVEQELLRQEISLMREELSLMRQEHGMMREELALMRQLITRSDLHFTIGMASEPTIPDDNT